MAYCSGYAHRCGRVLALHLLRRVSRQQRILEVSLTSETANQQLMGTRWYFPGFIIGSGAAMASFLGTK